MTVSADPPLQDQLTYHPQTNSIKFSGTLDDGSIPIVTKAKVSITIEKSLTSQSYEQQIILLPQILETKLSENEEEPSKETQDPI